MQEDILNSPQVTQNSPVKKVRTPKQLEATRQMQAKRAEAIERRLLNVDTLVDDKIKRRRDKEERFENMLEARMDKYHTKLIDELKKPVNAFLGKLQEEEEEEESRPRRRRRYEEEEEQPDPVAVQAASQAQLRERQREMHKPPPGLLKAPNPKDNYDFSQYFR